MQYSSRVRHKECTGEGTPGRRAALVDALSLCGAWAWPAQLTLLRVPAASLTLPAVLILVMALLAPVWSASAQAAVRASVDRNPVPLGETVVLTIDTGPGQGRA